MDGLPCWKRSEVWLAWVHVIEQTWLSPVESRLEGIWEDFPKESSSSVCCFEGRFLAGKAASSVSVMGISSVEFLSVKGKGPGRTP